MYIRNIRPKDNQSIKQLIKTSLEDLNLNLPGTAYFDESLEDLFSYYDDLPHAKYWVAIADEKIVGGIGIAPFDDENNICELQKLYVAHEVQGRGISNKLMDQALKFAAVSYRACYLETTSELKKARNLYKKYGFQLLEAPLMETEHNRMDEWYIKYFNDK